MKFFTGLLCGGIIAVCIEFAISSPAHYPTFIDHTFIHQAIHHQS
tara:strand:- start:1962 stop:2096 length:135 start_codon:yes stop_codon:yes gene_type:complete